MFPDTQLPHSTHYFIFFRVRMGIAFSIVAISLLAGTPIEGVLLRKRAGEFEWSASIIFCGVRFASTSIRYLLLIA